MWIRRKVKFLKIYDVNSNRLSHCVFLQASLPLPPFFPFTDTKPKVRLSPSHHSRHHSSVVHVLFAFSFCPSCIVNRLKQ
ncbi:hypothetical protein AAZX31_16G096800 [Glycine max]